MTKGNKTQKPRLVMKRSSKITVIAVCLAVFLSVVTILVLRSATLKARQEAEELRDQAQQLEQENSQLEDSNAILGSKEWVVQIAEKIWNFVFPDTIILEPEN